MHPSLSMMVHLGRRHFTGAMTNTRNITDATTGSQAEAARTGTATVADGGPATAGTLVLGGTGKTGRRVAAAAGAWDTARPGPHTP
jgi:hypothetical protein